MRTLIAKKHSFNGVENYFTDSFLNQDFLKTDKKLHPKESDSGNEADKSAYGK